MFARLTTWPVPFAREVRLALLLAVLGSMVVCTAAAHAASYYVDSVNPNASDTGPGTSAIPWKTLHKAVEATNFGPVTDGDTVYFRSGTYGAPATYEEITAAGSGSPGAPVTFQGYPGDAKPRILGELSLKGNYLVASGFVFDGPTGLLCSDLGVCDEQPQVWITGDNVTLATSEIREALTSGIIVGAEDDPALNFKITRNWIHDNGDFGDADDHNLHHGIYAAYGTGVITNNLVVHNYSYGVHLYPSPYGTLVYENTIVGNGNSLNHGKGGVIIAGEPGAPIPYANYIYNNIITSNVGVAVRGGSYPGGGNSNQANKNVVWTNTEGNFSGNIIVGGQNTWADPRFVSSTDFHLRSTSPAIDSAQSPYVEPIDFDGIARQQGDRGAFEFRP